MLEYPRDYPPERQPPVEAAYAKPSRTAQATGR